MDSVTEVIKARFPHGTNLVGDENVLTCKNAKNFMDDGHNFVSPHVTTLIYFSDVSGPGLRFNPTRCKIGLPGDA